MDLKKKILVELREAGCHVREEIGKHYDMELLKAEIEENVSFDVPSSEVRYLVNWVNEGGMPQNETVVAGESICDLIVLDPEGVKLFDETKKSSRKGQVFALKGNGYAQEGEVVAVVVRQSKEDIVSDRSTNSEGANEGNGGEAETEGVIYILENEWMPDVLKIGYTAGNPVERARSLSNEKGVPSHYEVVYSKEVADLQAEETRVHTELAEYRTSLGREFFKVDKQAAVDVIKERRNTGGSGYICVFENEEIEGLVLISSTTETPTSKARKLSSDTGVPTPYEVSFKQAVEKTHKSELEVRRKISKSKVDNKFFELSVDQAKEAIRECLSTEHGIE